MSYFSFTFTTTLNPSKRQNNASVQKLIRNRISDMLIKTTRELAEHKVKIDA